MRALTQSRRPMHLQRCMKAGFTLLEMLAVLAIMGAVTYSSMSAFKMLQPAARRSALQELSAALDEARSTALRKGAPSPFFIRRSTDEFGEPGIREFGVERQSGSGTVLLWRKLPGQVVLSETSIAKLGGRSMNAASLPMRELSDFDIVDLAENGNQKVGGLVFGEDGQVIYPSEEDRGQADIISLLVAHEIEDLRDMDATRHVRIEISPGTGRAYILE